MNIANPVIVPIGPNIRAIVTAKASSYSEMNTTAAKHAAKETKNTLVRYVCKTSSDRLNLQYRQLLLKLRTAIPLRLQPLDYRVR